MVIKKSNSKLQKIDPKKDVQKRSVEDRIFPGYDGNKLELEKWAYLLKRAENFHQEFNKIKYMQDPNMAMCREKAWDIQLRVKHEHDRVQQNIYSMNEIIVKQTTKK